MATDRNSEGRWTGPQATLAAAAWLCAALLAPAPALAQASRPATAGSLSGGASSEARCAVLRKRYLDSQACFERYRLANAAVKEEGFKRCPNVVDPSPQCGPNLPTK
jgi:hypothetical protein